MRLIRRKFALFNSKGNFDDSEFVRFHGLSASIGPLFANSIVYVAHAAPGKIPSATAMTKLEPSTQKKNAIAEHPPNRVALIFQAHPPVRLVGAGAGEGTSPHPRASGTEAETPDDIDQAVAGSREFLCRRCGNAQTRIQTGWSPRRHTRPRAEPETCRKPASRAQW